MRDLREKINKNNHIRPTLGAVFLAAAQLLSGCTPVTGEENLTAATPLAQIQEHGDARLNRIVARLRSSTLGEQLYTYAVQENTRIQWITEGNKAGAYSVPDKLIELKVSMPDEALILTLAHELRHHWQFTALKPRTWINSPLQQWQLRRFVEADACAFTAHFSAQYKNETGNALKSGGQYGGQIAKNYTDQPESKRNYLRDAVVPCFQELVSYHDSYGVSHYESAEIQIKIARLAHEKAELEGNYQEIFNKYMNVPDDKGLKAQFSQFLTLDLDPSHTIPEVKAASPEEFIQWVTNQTPSWHATELNAMQREFYRLRDDFLQKMAKPQPAAPGV